jgi:hypothetical protein
MHVPQSAYYFLEVAEQYLRKLNGQVTFRRSSVNDILNCKLSFVDTLQNLDFICRKIIIIDLQNTVQLLPGSGFKK